MQLINPFVPNDAENPSMAQIHQKSLKVRFVDSCLHSVWLIWDTVDLVDTDRHAYSVFESFEDNAA